MMVWPSPGGKSHPHHSGVRLGKCQANRKVNSADPPAGIDFCWHTCAYRVARCRLVEQCPILRKGIPKQHRRIPPTPSRPTAPMRGPGPLTGNDCERKTALHRVAGAQAGVGHQQTFQLVRRLVFIDAGVLVGPCHVGDGRCLDRVVDGKRNRDAGAAKPSGCSRDSARSPPANPRRPDHAG